MNETTRNTYELHIKGYAGSFVDEFQENKPFPIAWELIKDSLQEYEVMVLPADTPVVLTKHQTHFGRLPGRRKSERLIIEEVVGKFALGEFRVTVQALAEKGCD